jgi:hypothetical protein
MVFLLPASFSAQTRTIKPSSLRAPERSEAIQGFLDRHDRFAVSR